jgi:hypothetical protein
MKSSGCSLSRICLISAAVRISGITTSMNGGSVARMR